MANVYDRQFRLTLSKSTDFRTGNMNPDQLFEELKLATSPEKRQQLVESGLKSGIDSNEITGMLDYIDLCSSVNLQLAKSKNLDSQRNWRTLSALWQALFCRFRLR